MFKSRRNCIAVQSVTTIKLDSRTQAIILATCMLSTSFTKGLIKNCPNQPQGKDFLFLELKKKKPVPPKLKFKNQDDALQYARGKSQKRHKIKKKDYPAMIQSYLKAKKQGKIKEWGIDNGIKNPTQRVASWKKSLKKQFMKEAQSE